MKIILTISLGLLTVFSAVCKDYYIDIVGGLDSNDGSTLLPFKHCPGDTNATGNASSTTLAAGDNVFFKGGVTYTNTILLNWSGTAGNPITYDGNSSGAWGTGKAIFNGSNGTNKLYGFYGAGNSNLVFRSLDVTKWGGHGTIPLNCADPDYPGWGVAIYGSRNIIVRDSYFHDLGDWTNAPNANGNGLGIGVLFDYNSAGNIVTNCEFTQIGMAGVRIQTYVTGLYATNNLVIDSKFHDYIRWGVDVASAADNSQISDIIIDRCRFYNYYQYDSSTWLGCPASWPHTDPIIMRLGNVPPVGGQTLGTVKQPNIIRNCLWYNDTPVQYAAGTAGIFLTTWGGRLFVYNNIFNNVLMHGEGAIYCQDGTDPATNPNALPDYYFYNNTFFGDTYAVVMRTLTSPQASYAMTNGTVRIVNNALYKTDTGSSQLLVWGLDGYSTPTVVDYNRYYAPGRVAFGDGCGYIWGAGTAHYVDFAGMQSYGWEVHGSYGDPLFANISYGLGTQSSLNSFLLQAGSACVGTATNLSSYFNTDYAGITRTNWDIGAYAFTGSSPAPPSTVTGLKVTGRVYMPARLKIH